jgi:hypothetical protein
MDFCESHHTVAEIMKIKHVSKVKLSRYMPGQALGVPGG